MYRGLWWFFSLGGCIICGLCSGYEKSEIAFNVKTLIGPISNGAFPLISLIVVLMGKLSNEKIFTKL